MINFIIGHSARSANGADSGPTAKSQMTQPDPQASVMKKARSRANHRIAFLGHAVVYGGVCLLVLVVGGFIPAFITALSWGIFVAVHGFFGVIAPLLRERWIAQEVDQLHTTVTQQRRALGQEHARDMHQLSASVAHEIRNPVTAAKSLVQQMGEDPTCRENVEYARVAIEELDRVERSIAHLLRYAKEEELQISEMRLNEVVHSALDSFRDRLEGISLDLDLAEDDSLRGDPDKLRRVIINLIGNALDALADSAAVTPRLAVKSGHNLAGDELWLQVRDNGAGIDPDEAAAIFSPLHSNKERGTGLGLAITRKLVEAHGGSIEVSPDVTEGAELTVVLPRAPEGS